MIEVLSTVCTVTEIHFKFLTFSSFKVYVYLLILIFLRAFDFFTLYLTIKKMTEKKEHIICITIKPTTLDFNLKFKGKMNVNDQTNIRKINWIVHN